MEARSGLGALAGIACALGLACATPVPPAPERSYELFGEVRPGTDPWLGKVAEWQERARREEGEALPAPPASKRGAPPRLGEKMARFQGAEQRQLARRINAWAQFEAYEHYKAEPNTSFALDHWPTFGQLLETDGDDCDGLDLIAYDLLWRFGYARVYRAVVRRDRDGVHHMVTLWFERSDDPWVLDATGAMTIEMRPLSQVSGWTPRTVFNETETYSVVERGRAPLVVAEE